MFNKSVNYYFGGQEMAEHHLHHDDRNWTDEKAEKYLIEWVAGLSDGSATDDEKLEFIRGYMTELRAIRRVREEAVRSYQARLEAAEALVKKGLSLV